MKAVWYVLLLAAGLNSFGCVSIESIADRVLYPYENVNKAFPVSPEPPAGYQQVFFDLQRETGEPYKIHAWYRSTPEATSTILYLHGNGENLASLNESGFLRRLEEENMNIIVIDYPKYGLSVGALGEETFVGGAVAAIDFASRTFHDTHIVVWGRSIGASVATLAFAKVQSEADLLVLTSPWTSLYDLAVDKVVTARHLSPEWKQANAFDSALAANSINKPVLIHHGDRDTIIPVKFGRELKTHFKNATLIEIPEREHNDIFGERKLWDDVSAFASTNASEVSLK